MSESSLLLISQDLMVGSRVSGAAESLGLRVDTIGEIPEALAAVADGGYECIIIDLTLTDLRVGDVIAGRPDTDPPRVIAFGAHVARARLQDAFDAGCECFTRGKFFAQLFDILSQHRPS